MASNIKKRISLQLVKGNLLKGKPAKVSSLASKVATPTVENVGALRMLLTKLDKDRWTPPPANVTERDKLRTNTEKYTRSSSSNRNPTLKIYNSKHSLTSSTIKPHRPNTPAPKATNYQSKLPFQRQPARNTHSEYRENPVSRDVDMATIIKEELLPLDLVTINRLSVRNKSSNADQKYEKGPLPSATELVERGRALCSGLASISRLTSNSNDNDFTKTFLDRYGGTTSSGKDTSKVKPTVSSKIREKQQLKQQRRIPIVQPIALVGFTPIENAEISGYSSPMKGLNYRSNVEDRVTEQSNALAKRQLRTQVQLSNGRPVGLDVFTPMEEADVEDSFATMQGLVNSSNVHDDLPDKNNSQPKDQVNTQMRYSTARPIDSVAFIPIEKSNVVDHSASMRPLTERAIVEERVQQSRARAKQQAENEKRYTAVKPIGSVGFTPIGKTEFGGHSASTKRSTQRVNADKSSVRGGKGDTNNVTTSQRQFESLNSLRLTDFNSVDNTGLRSNSTAMKELRQRESVDEGRVQQSRTEAKQQETWQNYFADVGDHPARMERLTQRTNLDEGWAQQSRTEAKQQATSKNQFPPLKDVELVGYSTVGNVGNQGFPAPMGGLNHRANADDFTKTFMERYGSKTKTTENTKVAESSSKEEIPPTVGTIKMIPRTPSTATASVDTAVSASTAPFSQKTTHPKLTVNNIQGGYSVKIASESPARTIPWKSPSAIGKGSAVTPTPSAPTAHVSQKTPYPTISINDKQDTHNLHNNSYYSQYLKMRQSHNLPMDGQRNNAVFMAKIPAKDTANKQSEYPNTKKNLFLLPEQWRPKVVEAPPFKHVNKTEQLMQQNRETGHTKMPDDPVFGPSHDSIETKTKLNDDSDLASAYLKNTEKRYGNKAEDSKNINSIVEKSDRVQQQPKVSDGEKQNQKANLAHASDEKHQAATFGVETKLATAGSNIEPTLTDKIVKASALETSAAAPSTSHGVQVGSKNFTEHKIDVLSNEANSGMSNELQAKTSSDVIETVLAEKKVEVSAIEASGQELDDDRYKAPIPTATSVVAACSDAVKPSKSRYNRFSFLKGRKF